MPAILLIVVGLIFRDGTPYLFDGQGEVFAWCVWVGVVIVAIHLALILASLAGFAAIWKKF